MHLNFDMTGLFDVLFQINSRHCQKQLPLRFAPVAGPIFNARSLAATRIPLTAATCDCFDQDTGKPTSWAKA